MLVRHLWQAFLPLGAVLAQTTITGTAITTTSGTLSGDDVLPTDVTYQSVSTTITLSQSATTIPTKSGSNSTTTGTGSSTTSSSITLLVGGTATSRNGTASSTSSSAKPTNTQACNGYTEFCTRKYSNITMIAAHNFPFVKKNNAGSNQDLGVEDQLNDGIRMCELQSS
jgi:hypothetical protein